MAWVSYLPSGAIAVYYEYTPDPSLSDMNTMYPDDTFIQAPFGTSAEIQYVSEGEVVARAALTATWDAETVTADGSAEIVLSTLPIPCTVYIDGEAVTVEDGSLEFSTEAIGEYIIRVNEVAYLEKEWTINAV